MVEIPWVAAEGISKVVTQIKKVQESAKPTGIKAAKKDYVMPAKLKVADGDREDIKVLKESYNKVRESVAAQIKAGNLKKEDIDRLTDVLKAKRKAITGESAPIFKELMEERKAEGAVFKKVNDKLTAVERLLRENVILSDIARKRWKKMPDSTPEERALKDKAKAYADSLVTKTQTLFKEMKSVRAEKEALRDSLKPPSKPEPKTEISKDFVLPKGPKATLPTLEDDADFVRAMSLSNRYLHPHIVEFHDRAKSIYTEDSNPERDRVIQAVGGLNNFNKGIAAMRDFTQEEHYKEMRRVQRKVGRGEALTPQEKKTYDRVQYAEMIIAQLPKESIVKYRGGVGNDARLAATIAASQKKGAQDEKALASWSTSLRTAEGFADKVEEAEEEHGVPMHRILFRTVNKLGVSISSISEYEGEDEVLTTGNAKYRHTGEYKVIEYLGNDYHVFTLEELTP